MCVRLRERGGVHSCILVVRGRAALTTPFFRPRFQLSRYPNFHKVLLIGAQRSSVDPQNWNLQLRLTIRPFYSMLLHWQCSISCVNGPIFLATSWLHARKTRPAALPGQLCERTVRRRDSDMYSPVCCVLPVRSLDPTRLPISGFFSSEDPIFCAFWQLPRPPFQHLVRHTPVKI